MAEPRMGDRRIYYSEDAARIARRNRIVGLLTALAVGLSIGAVLALMFAPETGSETRSRLLDALPKKRGGKHPMSALRNLDLGEKVGDLIDHLPIGH